MNNKKAQEIFNQAVNATLASKNDDDFMHDVFDRYTELLLDEVKKEASELLRDRRRYLWLLSHLGSIDILVQRWDPTRDKPLLRCIQDHIDDNVDAIQKSDVTWFKKQKDMLK
jgi:hypothetical protein